MGSYDAKKEMEPTGRRSIRSKLLVLLLLVCSNLVTLLVFSGPNNWSGSHSGVGPLDLAQSDSLRLNFNELLWKLNTTQHDLLSTESELHTVKADLQTSNRISENLISELAHLMDFLKASFRGEGNAQAETDGGDPWGQWTEKNREQLPQELIEIVAGQKLPLGFNRAFNTDTVYIPIGHPCMLLKDDLAKYMSYERGGTCPDDDNLAQQLMLRGCEPLPRRRCRKPIPEGYQEPHPFPESMWTTPPDTSILWTPYNCKSYGCLIDRKNRKDLVVDCKDCFDLQFREKYRWLNATSNNLNFAIDEVLGMKKGTIRIGLDIGGGTATFAVRMRERNVTIVTTSMNFDGPFNNFIASRGVVPMFVTISQRLPFFDSTLDLVHSMHVLSNWIPITTLEFVLFDIYRVLRPGGLFWLDHFFCLEPQLGELYVPLLERIGFNKLKWSIGRKLDRGIQFKEMYISALLEKPLSPRTSRRL